MVQTATASWAIWSRLYSYATGKHELARPLQLYLPLFDAISESSRHLTIMNLDALFKGRQDTHSLANLLHMCSGSLTTRQAKECKDKLVSLKAPIKRIGKLRGNYFGHRIRTKKPQEFFRDAGLKIKDVDELLKAANWIMWQLACAFISEGHGITEDIEGSIERSVDRLLRCLLDDFNRLSSRSS